MESWNQGASYDALWQMVMWFWGQYYAKVIVEWTRSSPKQTVGEPRGWVLAKMHYRQMQVVLDSTFTTKCTYISEYLFTSSTSKMLIVNPHPSTTLFIRSLLPLSCVVLPQRPSTWEFLVVDDRTSGWPRLRLPPLSILPLYWPRLHIPSKVITAILLLALTLSSSSTIEALSFIAENLRWLPAMYFAPALIALVLTLSTMRRIKNRS